MVIRKATSVDADRISYLIQKVTDNNPNRYSSEQLIAWKKYNTPSELRKQLKDRVIFCAFKGKKLIGTIALKENVILGFYVSYFIRKTGVGTKLLGYVEEYALSNGVRKLKLVSTPSALKFYEKRGYTMECKVTSSIYGVDYLETKMEKTF